MALTCRRVALPILVSAAMLVAVSTPVRAQTESNPATKCASWIAKKGYSRDYVEQRTGSRPPPRSNWRDNIRPDELQVGDVVVLTLWPGHVAVVEEITRGTSGKPERMRVASFNYGRGERFIDRDCEVSAKFGVETSHWVALAETEGYWRPRSARK